MDQIKNGKGHGIIGWLKIWKINVHLKKSGLKWINIAKLNVAKIDFSSSNDLPSLSNFTYQMRRCRAIRQTDDYFVIGLSYL